MWDIEVVSTAFQFGNRVTSQVKALSYKAVLDKIHRMNEATGIMLTEPNSMNPSPEGKAWMVRARAVAVKEGELKLIAAPMRNRKTTAKHITPDEVLNWRLNHAPLSNYIHVNIKNNHGMLTLDGMVLEPTIVELCDAIRLLRELEYRLCKTKPISDSPVTSPLLW